MSPRSTLLTLSLVLPLAACSSAPIGPPSPAQAIVEKLATATAGVSRLTVHALDRDDASIVLASTDGTRIGQPSDKEDLTAMQTGKPVVLEEAGACDITVPVLQVNGKWTHAVGVTLKATPGDDRKQLVAKATQVASAVAAALAGK